MPEESFQELICNRRRWIQDADVAVADATRALGMAQAGHDPRHGVIAALRCEEAAALYLKTGLGMLARQQFAAASRHWSRIDDRERARLNQDRAAAALEDADE